MRISFKMRSDGSSYPAISPTVAERERCYCKRYMEFSEAMVDALAMRTVPLVWDVPQMLPCGCDDEGCYDCASGNEIPAIRLFYEAWEHPDLFSAATLALGERIGSGDAIFLVPQHDVIESLTASDVACIVARDISEIALVRGGYYGGRQNFDQVRAQYVHHAAAAILLQTCARNEFGFEPLKMEEMRDQLIGWSLRRVLEACGETGNGEIALTRKNPVLLSVLYLTWEMAAQEAPIGPVAPRLLLPMAESITARAFGRAIEGMKQAA